MKYKIQIPSANGWTDLMSSDNDRYNYTVDLYDTKELAEEELLFIKREITDFNGRVVEESIPANDDLYNF